MKLSRAKLFLIFYLLLIIGIISCHNSNGSSSVNNASTGKTPTQLKSSNSGVGEFTSFSLDGIPAKINGESIIVWLPIGTDLTKMVANFTTSIDDVQVKVNGVLQVSNYSVNDFTHPVKYIVDSYNGNTKTYTITAAIASKIIAGLGNGAVEQGKIIYGWQDYFNYSNGYITQAVMFNKDLIAGYSDGSIRLFDSLSSTNKQIHLPVNSAVREIVNYEDKPTVIFASGIVEQYLGNQNWVDLPKQPGIDGNSVTQMITYNDKLVLATNYGVVLIWDGNNWIKISDFKSSITKMIVYDNQLIIGLANGTIQQWVTGNNNWTQIYSSTFYVSQMIIDHKNHLDIGLSNGIVLQWDSKYMKKLGDGWSSRVTQMLIYDDGQSEHLVVGLANGAIERLNDTYWDEILPKTSSGVAVTQLLTYNRKLIAAFFDGTIKSYNGSGWSAMNASGWHSQDILMMLIYNSMLVIGLGDGSIKNYDVQYQWVELHNGGWKSSVKHMVTYTDPSGQYLLTIGLDNNAIEEWDGYKWIQVEGHSPMKITHMSSYNNRLLVGISTSGITDWMDPGVAIGGCSLWDGKSWSVILNQTPVNQSIIYKGNLIVGLDHPGAILKWNNQSWQELRIGWWAPTTQMLLFKGKIIVGVGSRGGVKQYSDTDNPPWKTLISDELASAVTQIVNYKDLKLFVSFANGSIQQWDDASLTWTKIQDKSWDSSLKEMIVYQDKLILGFSNGTLKAWDGYKWTDIHNNSWNSAVTQMLIYQDKLIVGLQNGSLEQWDGNKWAEIHDNSWKSPISKLTLY